MASTPRKTSVGVVFGGRSTEHEVSRNSGRAIMAELDPRKYDVHPILITKSGAWIVLPGPDAPPEDGEEVLFSGTPSGKPAPIRREGCASRGRRLFPHHPRHFRGRRHACRVCSNWRRFRSWVRGAPPPQSRWTRPWPKRFCARRGFPFCPRSRCFPKRGRRRARPSQRRRLLKSAIPCSSNPRHRAAASASTT